MLTVSFISKRDGGLRPRTTMWRAAVLFPGRRAKSVESFVRIAFADA
jgi:hypothetical protein